MTSLASAFHFFRALSLDCNLPMHLSVHRCTQQRQIQICTHRRRCCGSCCGLGCAPSPGLLLPSALPSAGCFYCSLYSQTNERTTKHRLCPRCFCAAAWRGRTGPSSALPGGMNPLRCGVLSCWGALGAEGAQGSLCVHSSVPGSCRRARAVLGVGAWPVLPQPPHREISGVLHTHCRASRTCALSASPPVLLRELGLMAAHGR